MEQKKQNIDITPQIDSILEEIHNVLNIDDFIFYGGAIIDLIINNKLPINDYDIAIQTKDKKVISEVIKNLEINNYKILEKIRYYKNIDIELIVIYASRGNMSLDIAFMKDVTIVGQFSINSLYCKYPEKIVIDKYNAIEDIKNKKIKLIRKEKENPYILLSIIMKLSSKYSIDLDYFENKKVVKFFIEKAKYWDHKSFFHNKLARASAISSLLRSIIRSKNKYKTFLAFKNTGIIDLLLPEVNNILNKDSFNNVKTKSDLIKEILSNLEIKYKKTVIKKIEILRYRNWDIADLEIVHSIN